MSRNGKRRYEKSLVWQKGLVDHFWNSLRGRSIFYEKPVMVYEDPIWRIKTKDDYMFDDDFWYHFQKYPFKICHIQYLCRKQTGNRGKNENVFDLRFAISIPAGHKYNPRSDKNVWHESCIGHSEEKLGNEID